MGLEGVGRRGADNDSRDGKSGTVDACRRAGRHASMIALAGSGGGNPGEGR